MANFFKDLTKVFSAGCLGGLTNSLAVWIFGVIGITTALGVEIEPDLTAEWLYPRIVWGGIWGVLFLLPVMRDSCVLRGLIYSIGPSLVMLFVVFPYKAGEGVMGMDLGTLTPVFVLIFNAVWGVTAALWLTCVVGKE
jgi:hypothetical protein